MIASCIVTLAIKIHVIPSKYDQSKKSTPQTITQQMNLLLAVERLKSSNIVKNIILLVYVFTRMLHV